MRILRDHDPTGQCESEWDPSKPLPFSLCIHAGSGERFSQTTGAMVSEIRPRDSVHWVTGTTAPCISIFKPVLSGLPLPAVDLRPTERFDAATLWWRHERLHRAALLRDFPQVLQEIREERDALEAAFRERVRAVLEGASATERRQVIHSCWQVALALEDRWLARIARSAPRADSPYALEWQSMSDLAGMP